MPRRLIASAALALCLLAGPGRADIIQDTSNAGVYFPVPRDFGQSFTADASVANLSSIGFFFLDMNQALPNPTVTATLYSGSGYAGPTVGSTQSQTIDASLGDRFVDFSFAGTSLTAGSVYTVRFVASSPARGGYARNQDDVYAGGTIFAGPSPMPGDLRFRVLGATAVPEPSAVALAGVAGLVLLGVARRRRAA